MTEETDLDFQTEKNLAIYDRTYEINENQKIKLLVNSKQIDKIFQKPYVPSLVIDSVEIRELISNALRAGPFCKREVFAAKWHGKELDIKVQKVLDVNKNGEKKAYHKSYQLKGGANYSVEIAPNLQMHLLLCKGEAPAKSMEMEIEGMPEEKKGDKIAWLPVKELKEYLLQKKLVRKQGISVTLSTSVFFLRVQNLDCDGNSNSYGQILEATDLSVSSKKEKVYIVDDSSMYKVLKLTLKVESA